MKKLVFAALLGTALAATLAGCSSTTLFKDNFNSNPLNAPPAVTQAVGTTAVFGDPGGATMVLIPGPAAPPGHWLQIMKQNPNTVAGMGANFSMAPGNGIYSFSGRFYIPKGAGAATVAFDIPQPVANGNGLLQQVMHLDFRPDNVVRIDDNPQTDFRGFQNNSLFTLSVKLDVYSACSVAHIALSGGAASGSKDYRLVPAPGVAPQQLRTIQLYMGSPWIGAFNASDLLVTYQPLSRQSANVLPAECLGGAKGP